MLSSAAAAPNFIVLHSASAAQAAFPHAKKLLPVSLPADNGLSAMLEALAAPTAPEFAFPAQSVSAGYNWYSPFVESPPDCEPTSVSCSSSVACCGCMELAPGCDNCANCPIDYSDPEFPYFTNCTGDQIVQIGPTYICVSKNVICTGDLFTVTFNVINISGEQWDWLPPNVLAPLSGPDGYAQLNIYAPGEFPVAETTCLQIEFVSSNRTPFGIYPAFDASNANGVSPRGPNIISIGWPLSIANGDEQVFTATFRMTGCCTCDLVSGQQNAIDFTAEVIRGCNCSTCYRCKPCDSPFNVIAVPNWRSGTTTCPPENCIPVTGNGWLSPFFDSAPSCESSGSCEGSSIFGPNGWDCI